MRHLLVNILLSSEDKWMEMGEESLGIVARRDVEDTLAVFEGRYELVLSSRKGTGDHDDAPVSIGVGQERSPATGKARRLGSTPGRSAA